MSKGRLIELLSDYHDEQEVMILLHSKTYPNGSTVFIQGVQPVKPWHDGVTPIVGIVAHADNKEL